MGEAVNLGNMNASPSGAGDFGLSKGGAASGASIASLGLSAFSSITKGQGTQAADEFQAAKAERAAQFGRLQAELTDTTMREQLNTTLSNIDVIRAAGRVDPTSPTTAAIEAHNTMLSDRQRTAALLNIKSQISEDEASAKYLHEAGDYALKMGYVDAGVKVGGAVAKAFTGI